MVLLWRGDGVKASRLGGVMNGEGGWMQPRNQTVASKEKPNTNSIVGQLNGRLRQIIDV